MAKLKKKKKNKLGLRAQMVIAMLIIAGVIFLPAAVLLCIAMIPTLVAIIADRSKSGIKVFTIGFMNFAGSFPFLLDLVTTNPTIDYALNLCAQPATIVMVYSCAAIGYLIDWAVSGMVASILVQKAKKRLNFIDKRSEDLAQQWGPEVRGNIQLDEDGFPVNQES